MESSVLHELWKTVSISYLPLFFPRKMFHKKYWKESPARGDKIYYFFRINLQKHTVFSCKTDKVSAKANIFASGGRGVLNTIKLLILYQYPVAPKAHNNLS